MTPPYNTMDCPLAHPEELRKLLDAGSLTMKAYYLQVPKLFPLLPLSRLIVAALGQRTAEARGKEVTAFVYTFVTLQIQHSYTSLERPLALLG